MGATVGRVARARKTHRPWLARGRRDRRESVRACARVVPKYVGFESDLAKRRFEDVSQTDDADELSVLDDGEMPNTALRHAGDGVLERLVRLTNGDLSGHHVRDCQIGCALSVRGQSMANVTL